MTPDDLDQPKASLKKRDLQPMSVTELKDYIMDLEAEITRANDAIDQKNRHRSGIDALFGTPKT